MQYKKRCLCLFGRNRGEDAAIPILCLGGYLSLAAYLILAFTAISFLSGCDDSDEELVAIEEIVENEEIASAKGKSEAVIYEIEKEPTDVAKAASETAAEQPVQKCFVYVCGNVNNPDVYELESDKHVIDAIKAAGGFTDEAEGNYLNLASPLSDGMKIYVPTKDEVVNNSASLAFAQETVDSADESLGSINGGLININEADAKTLMTLPGIGQSKADKIISYRESKGRFSAPSDIMLIDGIKNGLYDKIKDLICTQ